MFDLGEETDRLDWYTISHLHYVQELCAFDGVYNEPIDSLPTELLQEIMVLTPDPFNVVPEKWLATCQRLRSVCSTWRTTVNSTPYLFTKILIDHKTHLDLLRLWLPLSGTMNLCIFFSLGRDGDKAAKSYFIGENLVNFVSPYMSRCNEVFLRGSTYDSAQVLLSALNNLDSGSVRVVNIAAGKTAHITMLPHAFSSSTSCVQRIVAHRCAILHLPSSLTSLELRNIAPGRCITSPELCAALSHAPHIKQLVAIYVTILYLSRPRMELPSLTSLVIHCSTSQEGDIVRAFQLPKLQELEVQTDEPDIFADFIKMVSHGPDIACVRLSIYPASPSQMHDFFTLLPNLHCLHTSNSNKDLETVIVALVMRWPAIFPRLEQLQFGEQMKQPTLTDLFHALVSVSPQCQRCFAD
ncbi:hypothetical protein R3P38DRAFT_3175264 [Favolaschia claudopus]|uniref:F-box domain-containing protein n=1 Tax=Favolaschia claudopus TaxID=2862362 RepID=A0AAW0D9U5_9AGAR